MLYLPFYPIAESRVFLAEDGQLGDAESGKLPLVLALIFCYVRSVAR